VQERAVTDFLDFLERKPLYYDEIDTERMPKAYAKIRSRLHLPKIVHLVGTNGKGTTGRFLANALLRAGKRVGHYTSPHILRFNERIWLNGENVSDVVLQQTHEELLGMLGKETADALSYFEYTTLLAMVVYRGCDYAVLEAGLGGEFDATNVFAKDLSIFTPIGFDHQAFLGETIGAIAETKLRSMGPVAVIAEQPYKQTYALFEKIAKEKGTEAYRVQEVLDKADYGKIETIVKALHLPEYLQQNLQLAVAAVKLLGFAYESRWFEEGRMFGRLTRLSENIYLDVGHNTLAAKAILSALAGRKVTLVYNSYRDKPYAEILKLLLPIITAVEIIDVDDPRAEERSVLEKTLASLDIPYSAFRGVKKEKSYLVFGSFSVAEAFLKVYHG
jgi:dihydrofolate synthase/folylpolyglutamate synthase